MRYRDKFQRVQLPRLENLNAENSVLVKNMQQLKRIGFVKKRDHFSVRTYYHSPTGKLKKSPHLVTTSKRNLFRRAPKLFGDGLWLIVADQIDAKDCEFRGTIWITDDATVVEIALGPGTVRTVTNDCLIDENYELKGSQILSCADDDTPDSLRRRRLNYCVRQCRSTDLINVIFEFSYYKITIGWKKEQFICWEITDDGTHQCLLFKE